MLIVFRPSIPRNAPFFLADEVLARDKIVSPLAGSGQFRQAIAKKITPATAFYTGGISPAVLGEVRRGVVRLLR
jgi:hypothetical protein